MYQPTLGRFMSRDPLHSSGVQLLHPIPDMRRFAPNGQNGYAFAGHNPVNLVVAAEVLAPIPPLGTWRCANRPTTQTTGRVEFKETFTRECANCTETCRIRVTANRCFHESVEIGDDTDPRNFFTIFHVELQRTNRRCDNGDRLPDITFHTGGCQLYPGRLVFPGGGLSDKTMDYVTTLTSCKDFEFQKLCDVVKTEPPPKSTH